MKRDTWNNYDGDNNGGDSTSDDDNDNDDDSLMMRMGDDDNNDDNNSAAYDEKSDDDSGFSKNSFLIVFEQICYLWQILKVPNKYFIRSTLNVTLNISMIKREIHEMTMMEITMVVTALVTSSVNCSDPGQGTR